MTQSYSEHRKLLREENRQREEALREAHLSRLSWPGSDGWDLLDLSRSARSTIDVTARILRDLADEGLAIQRDGRWYAPGLSPGQAEAGLIDRDATLDGPL